jgi:dipeptidase E
LGGGGFSNETHSSLLDRYILSLTAKKKPRVCFLPTASGDSPEYVERFYRAFKKLGVSASHVSLFQAARLPATKLLEDQDIIYVGGGNTRNMLVLWKEWGVDSALRKAYASGTILAGTSAGAICWFEQGLTDSNPGGYTAMNAMGWLKGSFSPHFDSEPLRRPMYRNLIRLGKMKAGYAVDDGVALHFVDNTLTHVVSSLPKAGARYLERRYGELHEMKLSPQRLGATVRPRSRSRRT